MTSIRFCEFIQSFSELNTLCDYPIRFLDDLPLPDTVPKTVRYRQHPRVCPSNPQIPRGRNYSQFKGHQFKVGRSKK